AFIDKRVTQLGYRHAGEAMVGEGARQGFGRRPAKRGAVWRGQIGRQALTQGGIDRRKTRLELKLAPDGGHDPPPRLQRAIDLSDGGGPIREKLEPLLAGDDVEAAVSDGKRR